MATKTIQEILYGIIHVSSSSSVIEPHIDDLVEQCRKVSTALSVFQVSHC